MPINDRIRSILKAKGWNAKEFGERFGWSKATVSQRFAQSNWKVEELLTISNATGYSFSWICGEFGPELEIDHIAAIDQWKNNGQVNEPSLKYLKGESIRPITVVVNQQNKELMSYVPVKAQAGYMRGYGDSHFMEKLPAFSLPIMKDGSYRMFEVDGDSMLQLGGGGLHNGDIVIAQYVEDIFSIRDNRVYVVVGTEGVFVKRCLNRLKTDNPVLVCNSDNKNGNYKPKVLRPHEIVEVWELKAFISRQLSFSTDLWQMINDLQVQQALMEDKLTKLESTKLIK